MSDTNTTQWSESRCAHYELSFLLDANIDRAWNAITLEIGQWWLPHFHMLGPDSSVELELSAGGRLFERLGSQELLWYQILSINPNKTIEMAGWCTARYGGPAATLLSLDLVAHNDYTTQLKVSDSLFGQVTEGMVTSLKTGWQELFQEGLQAYLKESRANG